MNKFISILLAISLSTLVLTSCSSDRNNTPATTGDATPAPTSASAGEITSLQELYSSERVLDLKKAEDTTFYNTSDVLLYCVADLLSKATLIDKNNPEEAELVSKFDKNKCDYVLQFDGVQPIYISSTDNLFFFDRTSEIYKLWADSKNLWDNLEFDQDNKTVDIKDKGFEIQEKAFDSDINADGQKEKISLIYKKNTDLDFKGDLVLRVNDTDATVLSKTHWQVNPSTNIIQPPTIYYMPQKDIQNNIIIVTISWFVNSTEALGDVFAYKYNDGKLSEIDLYAPETVFNYSDGDTVRIDFPEVNDSRVIKFNSKSYERLIEEGKTLKKFLNDPNSLINNPRYFKLEDFDGDGLEELCSMSNLMFESLGRMSMGIEYTFYKAANNTVKPAKIIVVPPYQDGDKGVLVERYIMGAIFDNIYITFEDGEIKDSWYKPSEEFGKEDILEGINRMINENLLYQKENRIYVKIQ